MTLPQYNPGVQLPRSVMEDFNAGKITPANRTVSVTFLARVGNSPVFNEIVSVDVEMTLVPLPEEHAPDAVGAISVNVVTALRAAADKLEAAR